MSGKRKKSKSPGHHLQRSQGDEAVSGAKETTVQFLPLHKPKLYFDGEYWGKWVHCNYLKAFRKDKTISSRHLSCILLTCAEYLYTRPFYMERLTQSWKEEQWFPILGMGRLRLRFSTAVSL